MAAWEKKHKDSWESIRCTSAERGNCDNLFSMHYVEVNLFQSSHSTIKEQWKWVRREKLMSKSTGHWPAAVQAFPYIFPFTIDTPQVITN